MPEMITFDALIAAGYMRVKFSYCLYFKKKKHHEEVYTFIHLLFLTVTLTLPLFTLLPA